MLSVDSKVTSTPVRGSNWGQPLEPDDTGKRKIVDIGQHSSCALVGYLGVTYQQYDVATSLRKYVENHADVEADEAIESLLMAAARVWNDVAKLAMYREGDLPAGRKEGQSITSVWCGTTINGVPKIVYGETFVINGRFASWRRKPDTTIGGIGLDGELHTDDFFPFLESPAFSFTSALNPNMELVNDLNRNVVNDLSSNQELSSILASLESAGRNGLRSRTAAPYEDRAALSIEDVRKLFQSIYASVTKQTGGVGPPYNVRIFTPCGRMMTNIGTTRWTLCKQH